MIIRFIIKPYDLNRSPNATSRGVIEMASHEADNVMQITLEALRRDFGVVLVSNQGLKQLQEREHAELRAHTST